jgi:thiol-disulfide isomerase/thioredoxin
MRLLLIALSLLLASCGWSTDDAKPVEALWQTTLTDLDGKPVTLESYKGRPLIINFWARWCPPCRDEIPDFVAAQPQFEARGGVILGVAVEEQAEPVRLFARELGMNYRQLIATEQGIPLMAQLGNEQGSLPFTLAVDRQGNMVARKVGRISRTEIDAVMAAASP